MSEFHILEIGSGMMCGFFFVVFWGWIGYHLYQWIDGILLKKALKRDEIRYKKIMEVCIMTEVLRRNEN